MKISYQRHISTIRIAVMALFVLCAFTYAVFGYLLPQVEANMFKQRREMVKRLTEPLWSSMNARQEEVNAGTMTLKEAQQKTMDRFRAIRYGDDEKDYYWIIDTTPRVVMHPYRRDLEGKDVGNYQDPDGNRLFAKMVDIAKSPEGKGFLEYHWQWKDDPTQIKPKISYVRYFKPWNWIIGTGVYVDDIHNDIAKLEKNLLLAILVIFGVTIAGVGVFAYLAILSNRNLEKREHEVQLSAQRFAALFDLLPFSCIISDLQGRIFMANQHYSNVIGLSREEILGNVPQDKGQYSYYEILKSLSENLQSTDKIIAKEVPVNTPNGKNWMLIYSCMIDWQDNKAILAATVDITQRKSTEEKLLKSEQNLRATLNSIGDGVIATDKDGAIVRMNLVAERLTRWSLGDALGKDLYEVFNIVQASNRKPVPNLVQAVINTGKIVTLGKDIILVSRNDDEYLISNSGAPIRSDSGDLTGVVIVFHDITEEKKIQEQLNHIQKMESIGQLAGGVAHDFNNMIGGIIGATEMLQITQKRGEDPNMYINMILESAERAAALTNKLLAFARKQQIASSVIDALQPLRDALSLLENTIDKRIKIHNEIPEKQMMVVGDPSQLQNAYMNILINASHAMPEGGDIFVSSRIVELDQCYCEASMADISQGKYTEIEFRDTGCGIPKAELSRIFEPFYTTKERGKGTGLGLAAVQGTVQQHKGTITVYSEVGSGTCFHIFLPLTEEDMPVKSTARDEKITGTGTILIVDDERVMRATASAILEELGYKMLSAENGLEGLELFKQEMERIDLVILDMVMPEMNGRDCFLAMKELKPDVRVLLSSGFSREEEVAVMKQKGLKGFIRKPFRSAELSCAVRDAMR